MQVKERLRTSEVVHTHPVGHFFFMNPWPVVAVKNLIYKILSSVKLILSSPNLILHRRSLVTAYKNDSKDEKKQF